MPSAPSPEPMASENDFMYPLKPDPDVFTTVIRKLGISGAQVKPMWTIDDGMCENLRPLLGFLLRYKFWEREEPSGTVVRDPERLNTIYFGKEVIDNACATQAIINLLLNCNHPDVTLGTDMSEFKAFSMPLDPQMRGQALSNSQVIKNAHCTLAHAVGQEEDAFHFIGYCPINGRLYELDGVHEGPIDHGPIPLGQDWVDMARPIILNRIELHLDGEIRLMGLVTDRKIVYERRIDQLMDGTHALDNEDDVENEIRNLQMLIEYEDFKRWQSQQEPNGYVH